jgi:hypothetical protein
MRRFRCDLWGRKSSTSHNQAECIVLATPVRMGQTAVIIPGDESVQFRPQSRREELFPVTILHNSGETLGSAV